MVNQSIKIEKLFDMCGKTVIITGAAGLLGSQYAEALVDAGANVVLADLNYKTCKEIINVIILLRSCIPQIIHQTRKLLSTPEITY